LLLKNGIEPFAHVGDAMVDEAVVGRVIAALGISLT